MGDIHSGSGATRPCHHESCVGLSTEIVPTKLMNDGCRCLKYVINTQVNAFIKSAYFADRTKDLIGEI